MRQIRRLGYAASDVCHIVLTELDFDHAGGLEDFPDARVHVFDSVEYEAPCRASPREGASMAPRRAVG